MIIFEWSLEWSSYTDLAVSVQFLREQKNIRDVRKRHIGNKIKISMLKTITHISSQVENDNNNYG